MLSSKAFELLEVWKDIRRRIFSIDIQLAVIGELGRLTKEKIYLDLRNTSEAQILQLIDHLASLPSSQWNQVVRGQPLTLQSFLYDRVHYVETYLARLGHLEVFYDTPEGALLKWGLVDRWNERDTTHYP